MPTSKSGFTSNQLRAKHHVTAILVVHNGAEWLPEVVVALTSQKHAIDNLIAVDTGSTDKSLQYLKRAGIKYIQAPVETGFGEAVAMAIDSKLMESENSNQSEWLWLLHDDCAPKSDALLELLAAVEDRPQVALAGPKLRGWYDRSHLLEVGVSIASNGARWTGLEYLEQDQGQHDGATEVLAVSTAAALVRREVFDEVGRFDPELSLFRDDVDLGWRIHTAGHSAMIAPAAIAFHAEAAANERRSIDVANAFLHRPLLLDRRHAAYVLMANSSLWLTPLIALQLLSSAILRSIGFLLAKRPGYALDEIAAVALVLAQPQDLIRARRARKSVRLLSSRVISRFVPPRGTQLALTIDRTRDALLRSWRQSSLQAKSESSIAKNNSTIDFSDEVAENADIELVRSPSIFSSIKKRPILTSSVAVFLISLFTFRGRFFDLVGGALPVTPESGLTLLKQYADSWHVVGLGSSVNMPPWVAFLGLTSLFTLFNAKLLVSILLTLAIPLAFFGAYRLARKFTQLHYLALIAALLYSFAPVVVGALNTGRLGTVTLFVVGPWIVRSLLGFEALEQLSWRRTWRMTFLMALVFAFSPLAFLVIFIWQFILLILDVVTFNKGGFSKSIFDERNSRRIAILGTPFLICAPWSIDLILHPSRFLLDPGLAIGGGNVASILLANPGGAGSPPLWLISPVLAISLISLFVSKVSRFGEVSLFFMGAAMFFGAQEVAGHGSLTPEPLWVGSLLVIPTLVALLAGVIMIDQYLPEISASPIDYRHLLMGLISLISIFSLLASISWWAVTSPTAPLQSKTRDALPAFLTVGAQTDERFKTLVLRSEDNQTRYFIARDRDIRLGDPDVLAGISPDVNRAIIDLVTGAGIDSSKILAANGISYIFLSRPLDEDLVRTIDGVGGFSRASKTDEGITWKVSEALPHVLFISSGGKRIVIPSDSKGASGILIGPGQLLVSEKFDSRWKVLLDQELIRASESEFGTPVFQIPAAGEFTLYHDATSRRAWISFQLIAFFSLIVLALPARRRRSDIRIEELS
ncbi:MAG: glycosyltransferase [Actinomycetales bacterium]